MQISLEEVIAMLLSRVESLALNDENNKTRFNIVARALYKKGFITDQDIVDSVKEEHWMMKEIGLIQEEPGEETAISVADNILQWIRGDVEGIKKTMEEYEKRVKEYAREQEKKSSLTVASPDVLHQLDRLSSQQSSGNRGGSKLII
jgi:Mg2+/Co2+ transporter CorB